MAAPAEMTTLDISGRFVMNKTLSDDTDEVLTLQGVSWFVRKTISMATLTLDIKHYKDDDGVEHIDIAQTLSGIKGTSEKRTLDGKERPHRDHIFGNCVGSSKRVKLEDVEKGYLRDGWAEDLVKEGLVDSFVANTENDWTAHQIWGFEIIGDDKRYVRHLVFDCPKRGNHIENKLVYDYSGPVPE